MNESFLSFFLYGNVADQNMKSFVLSYYSYQDGFFTTTIIGVQEATLRS